MIVDAHDHAKVDKDHGGMMFGRRQVSFVRPFLLAQAVNSTGEPATLPGVGTQPIQNKQNAPADDTNLLVKRWTPKKRTCISMPGGPTTS